jgi:hypothetical protein
MCSIGAPSSPPRWRRSALSLLGINEVNRAVPLSMKLNGSDKVRDSPTRNCDSFRLQVIFARPNNSEAELAAARAEEICSGRTWGAQPPIPRLRRQAVGRVTRHDPARPALPRTRRLERLVAPFELRTTFSRQRFGQLLMMEGEPPAAAQRIDHEDVAAIHSWLVGRMAMARR